MKIISTTAIAIAARALISCSEDTVSVGTSLTNETEKLAVSTGTYHATSKSVLVDAVYSRDFDCYFGKVKDPETASYVESEFMTQFNMLENTTLPDKSKILSTYDGDIAADSCQIWIYMDRDDCYGDSLTPIKINILELDHPMSDTRIYYSNFDPKAEGYIRADGLKKSTMFSIANLMFSDSLRSTSSFNEHVRIALNEPYTDKKGVTYNNYGTYLLRNYYEHPEYFKNSYNFVNNLCPGFFFEISDGLGVMAMINEIDMRVFYRYNKDNTETNAIFTTSSTNEVLQTVTVYNDKEALNRLIEDTSCTYLKSPAGIFTEVTLPIDEITAAHEKDSLLSVDISFNRLNSSLDYIDLPIEIPKNVLMVMEDSVETFFETKTLYDNVSSYMTGLSKNAYTFNNISNIVTLMAKQKADGLKSDPQWVVKHPDWNKVLLIPISTYSTTSYDSYGSASSSISSIGNEMGLTSTKLVGGEGNLLEMKVIYAKFKSR